MKSLVLALLLVLTCFPYSQAIGDEIPQQVWEVGETTSNRYCKFGEEVAVLNPVAFRIKPHLLMLNVKGYPGAETSPPVINIHDNEVSILSKEFVKGDLQILVELKPVLLGRINPLSISIEGEKRAMLVKTGYIWTGDFQFTPMVVLNQFDEKNGMMLSRYEGISRYDRKPIKWRIVSTDESAVGIDVRAKYRAGSAKYPPFDGFQAIAKWQPPPIKSTEDAVLPIEVMAEGLDAEILNLKFRVEYLPYFSVDTTELEFLERKAKSIWIRSPDKAPINFVGFKDNSPTAIPVKYKLKKRIRQYDEEQKIKFYSSHYEITPIENCENVILQAVHKSGYYQPIKLNIDMPYKAK